MTTAACWETACNKIPAEITKTLDTSGRSDLTSLKLLAAIPEYEVDLRGGNRPSHTDVLVLARNEEGFVVIAVEAKVDETFGPTLGEKRVDKSVGQSERITYLHTVLRLDARLRIRSRPSVSVLPHHGRCRRWNSSP